MAFVGLYNLEARLGHFARECLGYLDCLNPGKPFTLISGIGVDLEAPLDRLTQVFLGCPGSLESLPEVHISYGLEIQRIKAPCGPVAPVTPGGP